MDQTLTELLSRWTVSEAVLFILCVWLTVNFLSLTLKILAWYWSNRSSHINKARTERWENIRGLLHLKDLRIKNKNLK